MYFRRKFSKTMYKNLKISLGEMSFAKDFIHTDRGDLYPRLPAAHSLCEVTASSACSVAEAGACGAAVTDTCAAAACPSVRDVYHTPGQDDPCPEKIQDNKYVFDCQEPICRLLGQFFPYATYEISLNELDGAAGFLFSLPDAQACVMLRRETETCCGQQAAIQPQMLPGEQYSAKQNNTLLLDFSVKQTADISVTSAAVPDTNFVPGMAMLVTCRPGAFDVYLKNESHIQFIKSFSSPAFNRSNEESAFTQATAALLVRGKGVVREVTFYMDCGISQADMRPIRYENGDVMVENGKIYLTMSIRMEERCYQGIFSWIPGTAEFQLTGALFFDAGDHLWGNDVASSILYHRGEQKWYLWVCSFCHDHILGHASFAGDVRFGVNVVDITLMEKAAPGEPLTAFKGFEGDEDPDFFFDEADKKWYLAICRLDPSVDGYRYFFYESDAPFSGYRCIGQGQDGAETGGSFVRIEQELCFCCGNSFELRANYRLYKKTGMENLRCDHDDGGFRGWGTIIPVMLGSRKRYFWLTFDRHNGSGFNWSYGNVYCFEADFSGRPDALYSGC